MTRWTGGASGVCADVTVFGVEEGATDAAEDDACDAVVVHDSSAPSSSAAARHDAVPKRDVASGMHRCRTVCQRVFTPYIRNDRLTKTFEPGML